VTEEITPSSVWRTISSSLFGVSFKFTGAVLSRAVVEAVIAAKAALLLDETPLERRLENRRRIVAVALPDVPLSEQRLF